MALDATAREANVRDSIKKYLYDNLKTVEGLPITFDRTLTSPVVQGNAVDRWVAVALGEMTPDVLASYDFTIFCCTKNDSEGFKLAQMRDKVVGYLVDDTKTDTMARITLYRSHPTEAWTQVGVMVVGEFSEVNLPDADDGTKVKSIDVRLRWGCKV
jgi:hypothetical protein